MKNFTRMILASGLMLILLSNTCHSQRAIDFMQIQGNSEELFLRVISEADAISAGNGVVKIRLPGGSTGAADLVATSDPDASEVRIRTPYGTRSWRRETFYGKCYGGSTYESAYSIAPSSDGGFALCGVTNSYGAGESDFLLLKVDEDGTFDWGKAMGFAENGFGYSIIQTNTGGYLVSGYEYETSSGTNDAYIYHLDVNGNDLLSGYYGTTTYREEAYCGIQASDNNFVLTGFSTTASSGYDVYVSKINISSAATIWSHTIGTTNPDNGRSIIQRNDGSYVVVGKTLPGGEFVYDIYLLLLNSGGTIDLSVAIGGSGWEDAWDVINTSDGNILIAGSTNSIGAGSDDIYLLKRASNGDAIWSTTLGGSGSEESRAVCEASDGGLLITGKTQSYGAGNEDLWLIKTDNSGNPIWSWVFGGTGDEEGKDVYQDPNGCIYVCGHTGSHGAGSKDALLVKFSPDGKTCLGFEVTPGSDNVNIGDFTATRMDHFNVDRTPLPSRIIKSHCNPVKSHNLNNQGPSDGIINITPTVTTICN